MLAYFETRRIDASDDINYLSVTLKGFIGKNEFENRRKYRQNGTLLNFTGLILK